MIYKQGYPIVIGLCGQAGTGKTVSATSLVPEGTTRITDLFWWDHKFLAMPLYEMASIRRDISGFKAHERTKHEMHLVLHDLFGKSVLYGLPDYENLVELVKSIIAVPIEMNTDKKPRTFLQTVGSMCRAQDSDVFINWMKRSIIRDNAWANEQEKQYICIVSDIRMPNEAKGIIEQPNGLVIKLTASPEVRENRLLNRDGFLMTEKQSSHESEQVDDIPTEYISHVLDTDNLSVQEQVQAIIKIASDHLGIALSSTTSPGELQNA